MVLRCLTCGRENPATSFFCGRCGAKLYRSGAEGRERAPVQSDGETETDARAKEEAERKRRTEIARWKEIDLESRGIFMPWNLTDPAGDPARDAARGGTSVNPASEARASPPPDSRNEVAGDKRRVEAPIPVATIKPPIPAPAKDAEAQEDDGESETASHLLRDIAVAVLVGGVILASAEWRSIRDHALVYLHQGAEPVSQHEERPVVPPAAASENTSAPVKEPSASVRPDRSSGVPAAVVGAPPAPGAVEMYQAAHASDPRLRAAWLWKAVRAGNPQATVELAKMYQEGDGVAQSCDQARILFSAAAAKGNAEAKLDLEQLKLRGCSEP
jgi:hypothetical protein